MPIPESQFDTWSHQGSITQSSNTYSLVRNALERDSRLADKDYTIFLQGSYGNDTNIYRESDVDIVIQLNSSFEHDLEQLDASQKVAFQSAYPNSGYRFADFKTDVLKALQNQFSSDVTAGDKAIAITASNNRRKSDVIAALSFRRYYRFQEVSDQSYESGICFYTASGTRIANYPRLHSTNLTKKHQSTNSWFKPMARILKNLRSRMVEEKIIESRTAPSYYLEGLLYNAPNECFGSSYQATFKSAMEWLHSADRSKFVCANEQYYLLRDGSPVTWRASDCDAFLDGAASVWNRW